MALRKFIRVVGSVDLTSASLNVEFELVNETPGTIAFNLNKDNVYISGSYSTKLDYYSVNGGIVSSDLMTEIVSTLENIKANYETYIG